MELLYSDFVKQFNLEGKSLYNTIGGQRIEEYSLKTKKIDVQSEAHNSNILATACYDYSTVFSPSICIDTDIYKERRIKKACEVKDTSASNQGAPVAVTLIEEKLLPQRDRRIVPNFIIHITNVGNGEIVDKNKIKEACSSGSFDRASWNYVYVAAFLGEQQLDCEPKREEDSYTGYVKIKDKEGSVRCRLEGGISTNLASYTTTLSINV